MTMLPAMDADRAKELLQRERERIEDALNLLDPEPEEGDDEVEPGDLGLRGPVSG